MINLLAELGWISKNLHTMLPLRLISMYPRIETIQHQENRHQDHTNRRRRKNKW